MRSLKFMILASSAITKTSIKLLLRAITVRFMERLSTFGTSCSLEARTLSRQNPCVTT